MRSLSVCFLLLLQLLDAAVVYNCADWPNLLEESIFVSCPGSISAVDKSVPSSLYGTDKIYIDVSNNELTGTLLNSVLSNLVTINSELVYFNIENNNIEGQIPSSFNDLPSITTLDLSDNAFVGSIPDFSGMVNLKNLDLRNNLLEGEIPSNLNVNNNLEIGGNNLTGCIPFIYKDVIGTDTLQTSGVALNVCTTSSPSASPTSSSPSSSPSNSPVTGTPSMSPTVSPSTSPSGSPSAQPTPFLTGAPTGEPTTSSPTVTPADNSVQVYGAIGLAVVLLVSVGSFLVCKGKDAKGSAKERKPIRQLTTDAAPPTPPTKKDKTFEPGKGWVEKDANYEYNPMPPPS